MDMDGDNCVWCNAYEYATNTLGMDDDDAAKYANERENRAVTSK